MFRRFSFCQYPFILSLAAKRDIMQKDSEQQMIMMARVSEHLRRGVTKFDVTPNKMRLKFLLAFRYLNISTTGLIIHDVFHGAVTSACFCFVGLRDRYTFDVFVRSFPACRVVANSSAWAVLKGEIVNWDCADLSN